MHPAVYWVIVGLAGWLVLSVWGFLGSGYAGLALMWEQLDRCFPGEEGIGHRPNE